MRVEVLSDNTMSCLKLAEHYWKRAPFLDKKARIVMAETLNSYGVFSLTQLAKIVDLHPRELSGRMEPKSGGGRFEPSTLGTLIMLRQHRLLGLKVAPALVRMARDEGTSLSCICALTGIPYTTYYRQLEEGKK